MLFHNPAFLKARANVLLYFTQSDEAQSQQSLFDWVPKPFGQPLTYELPETDTTLTFIQALLERCDKGFQLPPQSREKRRRGYGGGNSLNPDATPDVHRR